MGFQPAKWRRDYKNITNFDAKIWDKCETCQEVTRPDKKVLHFLWKTS